MIDWAGLCLRSRLPYVRIIRKCYFRSHPSSLSLSVKGVESCCGFIYFLVNSSSFGAGRLRYNTTTSTCKSCKLIADMQRKDTHGGFRMIADQERSDWNMSRGAADQQLPERDLAPRISRDKEGLQKSFSGEGRRARGDLEYERLKRLEKLRNEKSDTNSGYRKKPDQYSTEIHLKNRGSQFFTESEHKDMDYQLHKDSNYVDRRHSMNGFRERSSSTDLNGYHENQSRKSYNERERYWNSVDRQEKVESERRSNSNQISNNQWHYGGKNFDKVSGHQLLQSDFDTSRLPSDNVKEHYNVNSPAEPHPTKRKLKLGGVTQTIHPELGMYPDLERKPDAGQLEASDSQRLKVVGGAQLDGSAIAKSQTSAPVRVVTERNKRRHKLILPDDSDDNDEDGGVPPKPEVQVLAVDVSNVESSFRANGTPISVASTSFETICKSSFPTHALRKSSRIPKKRVLDGDEVDIGTEPKNRQRKKSEQELDDQPQVQEVESEEEAAGYGVFQSLTWERTGKRKMRKRIEPDSSIGEVKREMPLTSRQRALQYNKENGEARPIMIEFPEGLSHCSSKKKKEVLTNAEQQLKKEEAAQKRRQQVEKNAKEIQAVTIQKVLGQESQRRKREDKLQKLREELEQERKAAAMTIPPNTIRWVMGSSSTVLSFSEDVEMPKIFSGPCSYPKERVKCAAPFCNNAYKYRDSKSLVPLCSLQCYKAVQKPP